MSFDNNNNNVSYILGGILAIYNNLEKAANTSSQRSLTNAEKSMSAYFQNPYRILLDLSRKIIPYKNKLEKDAPGLYVKYDKELTVLISKLDQYSESDLKKPITTKGLIGFYAKQNDLYTKNKLDNSTINEENNEDNE